MNVRFEYRIHDRCFPGVRGQVILKNPERMRASAAGVRLLKACSDRMFEPTGVGLVGFLAPGGANPPESFRHEFVGLAVTDDSASDQRTLTEFVAQFETASQLGWPLARGWVPPATSAG